jgi:hypothetical protein
MGHFADHGILDADAHALRLVLAEREKAYDKGFTPTHDDSQSLNELIHYALGRTTVATYAETGSQKRRELLAAATGILLATLARQLRADGIDPTDPIDHPDSDQFTLGDLYKQIGDTLKDYPEHALSVVRVQDQDGIYESEVEEFNLAGDPFIIVTTQDKED